MKKIKTHFDTRFRADNKHSGLQLMETFFSSMSWISGCFQRIAQQHYELCSKEKYLGQ